MSISIILYGSRARDNSRACSDTDLLLADAEAGLGNPVVIGAVSLHHYPQPWLLEEASKGNLFVLHVGLEGVALHDEAGFLPRLKERCRVRPTYEEEIGVATATVLATINASWKFDPQIRRRFFWAIRTIMIARSAEYNKLTFDTLALEELFRIDDFARVVESRLIIDQDTATEVGLSVVRKLGAGFDESLSQQDLLKWLSAKGGIAFNTARMLGELEASALGASIYE